MKLEELSEAKFKPGSKSAKLAYDAIVQATVDALEKNKPLAKVAPIVAKHFYSDFGRTEQELESMILDTFKGYKPGDSWKYQAISK